MLFEIAAVDSHGRVLFRARDHGRGRPWADVAGRGRPWTAVDSPGRWTAVAEDGRGRRRVAEDSRGRPWRGAGVETQSSRQSDAPMLCMQLKPIPCRVKFYIP